MNIVLLTNTFTPHVGGVARSVEAFARAYRDLGHRVVVVAPEFEGMPEHETDVIRVPAIQKFNGSDFSVVLPVPTGLHDRMHELKPDIIHSQHPFLLGMTAMRLARTMGRPLVFTHHTLYEQYTHYVPGESRAMQVFIIELATRYANLADQVFAPSESIRDLLIARGVTTPIAVVPTGVTVANFAHGRREDLPLLADIPAGAYVVGHVGRLAPEKNLAFLAEAVLDFMRSRPGSIFLLVGAGPSLDGIAKLFADAGMSDRLVPTGVLQGERLAAALGAMDVFAFASTSETQGMVLTEAMAAGVPVVALDASGAREVLRDGHNGRLVQQATIADFGDALRWLHDRAPDERRRIIAAARATAEDYSMPVSAAKALSLYEKLCPDASENRQDDALGWDQLITRIKVEWDILKSVAGAGDEALQETYFGGTSDGAEGTGVDAGPGPPARGPADGAERAAEAHPEHTE